MTREEFFALKNKGALWDVGVSINRTNPLPLDKNAVFDTYDNALTYAKGVLAYPGQFIAVVGETAVEAYLITVAGGANATLVKLAATIASGDLASDVAALQTKVNGIVTEIGKAAGTDTEATGLYKLIAEAKAAADAKVASVAATDNTITVTTTDPKNPTIGVKVSAKEGNALKADATGMYVEIPKVTVPEYTIEKLATTAEGASASYALKKDDVQVGVSIDIPKDMVVSGGEVKTYVAGELPEGVAKPGTYIVLVLANATNSKLYINVGDLIEYVKGGTAADGIITTNVAADTHIVTATIKDGGITKVKLATAVQESLGKADTAIQEIIAGTTNGTIKVDGTEVAVTGLQDAAYQTAKHFEDDATTKVNAAKTALIGTDEDTKAKDTIKGAKKYADDIKTQAGTAADEKITTAIGGLKNADEAVTKEFVTAVKEANGIVTVERKALTAADIPEIGIAKVTNLQDTLDGKQASLSFEGEYNFTTNKVVTKSALDASIAGVVGKSTDESTDNTIEGTKKLVAETKAELIGDTKSTKDSNTIEGAKRYADNIKTQVNSGLLGDETDTWDTDKTLHAVHNEVTAVNTIATAAKEKAEANETAISTLNGTGDGSVAKQITTAINKLNATDADATGVVRKVTQENGVITAYHGQVTEADISPISHTKIKDWDTELGKKQDNLVFNTAYNATNNKVATMTDVNNAVSGLSGAMHYVGDSTTDPTLEAGPTVTGHFGAYAKGDVVTYNKKEFVYDGAAWRELGDEGSYALKDSVYTKTDADNTFVKKETGKRLMTETEGTTLANINTTIDEAVEANTATLDVTDTAADGKYVSAVSQKDGKIAVTRAEFPNVNVNKLFIAEGDTLVLNGGTALS